MKALSISTGVLFLVMTSIAAAQMTAPTTTRSQQARKVPGTRQAVAPMTQDEIDGGTSQTEIRTVRAAKPSFFQLAPVAGYTYSTFSEASSNGSSVDSLSGFQGGGLLLMGRGFFQVETGLIYSERGAKFTNNLGSLSNGQLFRSDFEAKLRYLEVPLMARYSFTPRHQSRLFIKGGVIAGILQSAEHTILKNDAGRPNGTENAKSQYQETDYRAAAGVGGEIKITKTMSWLLQGDYQYGLKSAVKSSSVSPKISAFSISTGLNIDL